MTTSLARIRYSPGASVTGGSAGNSSSMLGFSGSSVNRQGAFLSASYSVTGATADIEQLHVLGVFHSPSGWYMISRMTTGPTAGAALASPGVGLLRATKLYAPVLFC